MKNIRMRVTDSDYKRLQRRKTKDIGEGESWDKWAKHIAKEENVVEPLTKKIAQNTRETLAKLWMKNLGANLATIRASKISLRDIASEISNPVPCIVVGAGPSLYEHDHIEKLKKFKGVVFATDRMLIPLLKAGIKVDYVVSIDGNGELIPAFFDDPIVEKSNVKVCLVLQTHPNTLAMCKKHGLQPYWFHTMQDDPKAANSSTRSIMYMTMSDSNPLGVPSVPSGGNCGTTALCVAIDVLKHAYIGLIGFDFGYPKGMPMQETYYYSSIFASYNKLVPESKIASTHALVHFKEFYHPIFKSQATSDPVFDGYRESLYEILAHLMRPCKIYNLTEGGTLYNPQLFECMTLDKFLNTIAKDYSVK